MRKEKEGLCRKTLNFRAVLRKFQLYQKVSKQRLPSRDVQPWAGSDLVPTLHLVISREQPMGSVV